MNEKMYLSENNYFLKNVIKDPNITNFESKKPGENYHLTIRCFFRNFCQKFGSSDFLKATQGIISKPIQNYKFKNLTPKVVRNH